MDTKATSWSRVWGAAATAAGGGPFSLTVNAAPGCSWTLDAALTPWLNLETTNGDGSQSVTYSVAPNATGKSRKAKVVVMPSKKAFPLTQAP